MKAVFLPGAEEDLKELRRYVIQRFGKNTWSDTYGKIKTSVRSLQAFPLAGSVPEELADLGLGQYRQVISGMNRIIYEVGNEVLYIHIVCDTRRDMQTLLVNRLLRMTKK
ncbi:type II toxin-antitoxin system RelE/ParE family toxin [Extensimonas vulgaris]|uniref:Plasmid stabilization system protein ParE n=1 Tax=Extensimonas vulgaris TaxID=1031594 RepID=A0A369AGZ8_9BURK|nr:type II toxin-antitoxin system RelE/ParE family toxin [Extensimonas vulgaris]RCX07556.1 plasmid stabilization system protein ParE [Extensimonas vulgaris]TWI41446.1 plasmid stabilization system protein ParE [Extensimonas vulgaris]TXD12924.1 type II toxin-antitoxin system RelE/ParE family toxin [Extensimonas vulgaris]